MTLCIIKAQDNKDTSRILLVIYCFICRFCIIYCVIQFSRRRPGVALLGTATRQWTQLHTTFAVPAAGSASAMPHADSAAGSTGGPPFEAGIVGKTQAAYNLRCDVT